MAEKTQPTGGGPEIVVVGGGYAGVIAANRLRKRPDLRITLVNPRPMFVQRIRLHQLVAGNHDAVADYRDVLAAGVRLAVATVTSIDVADRRLVLDTGDTLGYDQLVYAVGSVGADGGVPGVREHALRVGSLEEAERLRTRLDGEPMSSRVTVVGAGPTGIELAAELAESGRTVRLVCGAELGPYLGSAGRRSARRQLQKLGVSIVEGPGTRVAHVFSDGVRLADGRLLASAITVWTAGFGAPDLARRSGLSTAADGRLLTDETLTSVDDPRIVATGDAAAPSGVPYRMSCQAAVPLGVQAANTVLSHLGGAAAEDVAMGFVGQCISLGRHGGVIQFAHRDDTATAVHIGGRAAAAIKETVCRSTVFGLSREAVKPGSMRWLADRGRADRIAAAAVGPADMVAKEAR